MKLLTRTLHHPWILLAGFLATVLLAVRLIGPAGRAAHVAGNFPAYASKNTENLLVALAIVCTVWLLYKLLLLSWHRWAGAAVATRPRRGAASTDRWPSSRAGHQYVPGSLPHQRTDASRVGRPDEVLEAHEALDGYPTGQGVGGATPQQASAPTGDTSAAGDSNHLSDEAPARLPPRLDFVTVDREVVGRGLPVEVTWSFTGADRVSVNGEDMHPAAGSTLLVLEHTGAVTLIAYNRFGRTSARSRLVIVLPVPAVSAVRLPAPPGIHLRVDVSGTISKGRTAGEHLEALFRNQDSLRPAPTAMLRPIGVPRRLINWLLTPSEDPKSSPNPITTTTNRPEKRTT